MSRLEVTLIDVGWGDSILIATEDTNSNSYYALIDSNDTATLRCSYIFLKRFFDRKGIKIDGQQQIFEFVLLSHAHADHGQGLKGILRTFGTKQFWYPEPDQWSSLAYLLRYANTSKRISHPESIDNSKVLPPLGDVQMNVLWPLFNKIDHRSENNNSVVLTLALGNVTFVLTGDAEGVVWDQIANQIPPNTQFFKVPHHGSENGTFASPGNAPWFRSCRQGTKFGISSHVRPFQHPDNEVIKLLSNSDCYRTDQHYHLTFETDGTTTEVKYSHFD